VSHAAPERASIETGGVFSGTGRHGGRRRAIRGPEARFGQLPYAAVTVGVGIALLIISQGVHLVRSGTLVLAGVLLIAATARLVLPERRAGLLSSRRRLLDVAILGALGIGLLVAGLVVPVPS
jgi:Protein of unknown function (DUF3017)